WGGVVQNFPKAALSHTITDITRMRMHPPLRAAAIASCMALLKHPGMWRSNMPASIPRSRHI
ncbi:hypothetical protein, partial [Xanthomonas oryzae]|uniref:hypothetical protein n=1 Tax=Xanthomonas oryzae TaxID=347 RepID=UPI001ED9488D